MFPEDPNIPEFMHKTYLCEEPTCIKRVLKGSKKCIDCEVESTMPKILDIVDDACVNGK